MSNVFFFFLYFTKPRRAYIGACAWYRIKLRFLALGAHWLDPDISGRPDMKSEVLLGRKASGQPTNELIPSG
jgi:hypothetical protein